jgi:hypothetical protein
MDLGRWRTAWVVMTIAASISVPAAADDGGCAVETRLHWVDVVGLAPFAYDAVAAETRRILAEHGVCAELQRATPASVRPSSEIGMVLLPTMAGSGVGRRIMGATRSRDARNATVWVYFQEVAAALGLGGPAESWTAMERVHFSRALGRVAAHEIVHALLPDRPHDRAGLMARSLGRRELTASVLRAPGLLADIRRLGTKREARIAHGSLQAPAETRVLR